jgi:hypothetical protein
LELGRLGSSGLQQALAIFGCLEVARERANTGLASMAGQRPPNLPPHGQLSTCTCSLEFASVFSNDIHSQKVDPTMALKNTLCDTKGAAILSAMVGHPHGFPPASQGAEAAGPGPAGSTLRTHHITSQALHWPNFDICSLGSSWYGVGPSMDGLRVSRRDSRGFSSETRQP